jgi:tetratricopeptide (TPR) repeat protein
MKFLLTILVSMLILVSCGSDPEAEAAELIDAKQYVGAINVYKKAMKEAPEKADLYASKITYLTLKNGASLYESRVAKKPSAAVSAFELNYNKAIEAMPEEVAVEVKKDIAQLLLEFSEAIYKAEPSNSIKAAEYERLLIESLEHAASLEPDNADIKERMDKIYQEKFETALSKGDKYYSEGSRRNGYPYIQAEFYYAKALKFMPEDEELAKKLANTRKKTISLWDPDLNFIFAIVQTKRFKQLGHIVLAYSIKSNVQEPVDFSPANFVVHLKDGNTIGYDAEVNKEYSDQALKDKTLKDFDEIDGVIAYAHKGTIEDFEKVVYTDANGNTYEKYF